MFLKFDPQTSSRFLLQQPQALSTGRSSILLIKIYLVPESSLLGTLRAVYPRRRHLYSDGLRTTEYTAFCFV